MSIDNFVKRIRDIMRNDAGVNGDAQRIEQLTWLLFLKVYDQKEDDWELDDDSYKSIIPEECRWRNWAHDDKSGKALTGEKLLSFINITLFPTLKNLTIDDKTLPKQAIIKTAFEDNNNYMKDGILLRQIINIIDEVNFHDKKEKNFFGDIYENILNSLQSAGSSGEFYTPRAVTDFIVDRIAPKLDEKIADFACGTGGFLTSSLNYLKKQVKNLTDDEKYQNSVFGIEKKSLSYLLCITNLLLHDIETPNVKHDNSLGQPVADYKESDKFNIIVMNPPYGGSEKKDILSNFPANLRSSETADLFMTLIMYRLKQNGRCAVILPDGFLFGDEVKRNIKEKLFQEFNLHTIVRLPKSVFAPYTSITTNILFFDKTEPTQETWFYRLDLPTGYKAFSKTKPIQLEHFKEVLDWWGNRTEINQDGFDKSKKYTIAEIKERNYNIDLCGFPHAEEEILEPKELIERYETERAELNRKIDDVLKNIMKLLGE